MGRVTIDVGGRGMEVERIFCIGRNYRAHMAEMGTEARTPCVVFMKPACCIVPQGDAIVLPRGRGAVHHEVELVVAIGTGGSCIRQEEALSHVAGYALGLDLTLRDLQAELKAEGNPWEACKAFEGAAPLGPFVPASSVADPESLGLRCAVNGEVRQDGNTAQMIRGVAGLVSQVSQSWCLRRGDLIYTGTPSGIGPLEPGDSVEVSSPQLGGCAWMCR
jgi:2-keto-4-pentenoate hydratase/2-oxohepta-3-ene-1,7-dioic acid hydratase in catechol pathway